MKRYLRLLRQFFVVSIRRVHIYPSALVSSIGITLYWFALTIVSISILTYQAPTVGGWNRYELFVVQGVYSLTISFLFFCIDRNISQFIEDVWNGNFDYKLLKPIDSQFLASFGYFKIHNLARMIAGVMLITYSIVMLQLHIQLFHVALFLLFVTISIVLGYSLWILIASVSFWSPPMFNLSDAIGNFLSLTRYPLIVFRFISDALVYVLLPLVVITTVPAQIILQRIDIWLMISAGMLTILCLFLSRFVWKFALRYYTSASS